MISFKQAGPPRRNLEEVAARLSILILVNKACAAGLHSFIGAASRRRDVFWPWNNLENDCPIQPGVLSEARCETGEGKCFLL